MTAEAHVELFTWARQQLDEDERVINAACLHIDDCNGSGFSGRFDDDRMLAEVESKRRILELIEIAQRETVSSLPYLRGADRGYRDAMNDVLRELAQPYIDRPGWREEWRL